MQNEGICVKSKIEVNKIVSFSEMYIIFVVILLIFAGCCKTIRCTMAW